ncbi:hypothetical protein Ancab_001531 [Ancistrocladus abbreviatus]
MVSKLLLVLSAFLLLVTARAAHDHDKHEVPTPSPPANHTHNAVPPPVHHHAGPPKPAPPPIKKEGCVRLCEEKCKSESHRRKWECERTCTKCCRECKCIPRTYGNQENCKKCYDKRVAHGIKCSTMISTP